MVPKPPNKPTYLLFTLPAGTQTADYSFQDITLYFIIFLLENADWYPNFSCVPKDFLSLTQCAAPTTLSFQLSSDQRGTRLVPMSRAL